MRYRTQVTPSPNSRRINTRTENGVLLKDDLYPRSMPAEKQRIMHDVVTPKWRRVKASGGIVNNLMFLSDTTILRNGSHLADATDLAFSQGQPVFAHERDHYLDGFLFDVLIANGTLSYPPAIFNDVANKRKQAIISCLGNVNKTEFDAGTFAGEWSKTKRLHLDVLSAAKKLLQPRPPRVQRYQRVKETLFDEKGAPLVDSKGRPISYNRHVKLPDAPGTNSTSALANSYLVGRYGIAPLLHDLEEAYKLATKRRYPARQTARGSYTDQSTAENTISVPSFISDQPWLVKAKTVRTLTCRFGILYESSPASQVLASLGISRPLSSAWELTPWSFVGDWFLQIGKWLDAAQPTFASRNLASWEVAQETVINSLEVNGSRSYNLNNLNINATWNEGRIESRIFKSRTPTVISLPTLPALGSGITGLRGIDTAALLQQLISSRFRK